MLLVRAIAVAPPEQMLEAAGVAVAEGIGLTVTLATIGVPAQPPAVGVIVYTAVPALVVVAVSVWAMVAPELAEAPVTFVCVTVQAKVVPPVLLVNAMEVAPPEQIVWEAGVAVAVGLGLTVTVTICTDPGHPPVEVGVTVYTTV